jgi:hypothetical protein
MATSGTVATTTLDTAVLLEHAIRRCGIPAANQTPETVLIGQQNLYLLLLNLANRGLNLWCVEKDLIPLTTNQATYDLPAGTVRLLNVMYSQMTQVTGTDTAGASTITTELTSSTQVLRWGFKLSAGVTGSMLFESSDDGVTWTTQTSIASTTWDTEWYWYELDPPPTATYYRLSSSVPATFDEFFLASAVRDIPMTQFNRDEYTQQPNKQFSGSVCTNFYYDKLVNPTITVWPVPSVGTDQLSVWRHRFVQDVGTLTQQIEVPQVWLEAVVWMLAARLVYELPGVDPGRRKEVVEASSAFLMEAELGESDNAPVYFVPGIGCYTR